MQMGIRDASQIQKKTQKIGAYMILFVKYWNTRKELPLLQPRHDWTELKRSLR